MGGNDIDLASPARRAQLSGPQQSAGVPTEGAAIVHIRKARAESLRRHQGWNEGSSLGDSGVNDRESADTLKSGGAGAILDTTQRCVGSLRYVRTASVVVFRANVEGIEPADVRRSVLPCSKNPTPNDTVVRPSSARANYSRESHDAFDENQRPASVGRFFHA